MSLAGIVLAAALPHVQIATAIRGDSSNALDRLAGAGDQLDRDGGERFEASVWLSWDLARILDDASRRSVSALHRDVAEQRADDALLSAMLADRAAAATVRTRTATTALEAADALMDREEALASRPRP